MTVALAKTGRPIFAKLSPVLALDVVRMHAKAQSPSSNGLVSGGVAVAWLLLEKS